MVFRSSWPINAFNDDPTSELQWLRAQACRAGAAEAAISTHYADGGKGSEELARAVIRGRPAVIIFFICMISLGQRRGRSKPLPGRCTARRVSFDPQAERDMQSGPAAGVRSAAYLYGEDAAVAVARPALKGRPTGFTLPIKRCDCSQAQDSSRPSVRAFS